MAAVAPAQAIAYVSIDRQRYVLKVMDSDGTNQRALHQTASPISPSMSPDGREVAFTDVIGGQRGVWVIGSDGQGLRLVTPLLRTDSTFPRPAWSPVPTLDGRHKLLFLDWRYVPTIPGTAPNDLYVVDLDGSGRQQLTADQPWENHAEWSHDATRIVFVRGSGLVMADLGLLDGRLTITAETPISQVPGSPLQAATSLAFPGCANTGSVVVVSAITPDSGGEFDLWLVQVATPAVPVRLTNTASYSERWATFSPDDRLLCFHRDMKGVLVMTLDGGGTTVLDRKGVRPNHRRR